MKKRFSTVINGTGNKYTVILSCTEINENGQTEKVNGKTVSVASYQLALQEASDFYEKNKD